MLSRVVRSSRAVAPSRSFSIFDRLMNDPRVKEKAAEMMRNPDAMNAAMANLTSTLKGDGGGMAGMLIRNSPIKGVVDKLGGVENIERMLSDPKVREMMQNMMKDPAAMARVTASVEEVLKKDGQLPDKK